jgi:hypothetical protein
MNGGRPQVAAGGGRNDKLMREHLDMPGGYTLSLDLSAARPDPPSYGVTFPSPELERERKRPW